MGAITWIEESLQELDGTDFYTLVDRDDAIRIAQNEDFKIEDPSRRVDAFITALPSLFDWFGNNYRDFPWRRTSDPWEIIVAEILLQRTHAENVGEVYGRFFDRFPDVAAVHAAKRDEVFKTIEPVGMGDKKTRTLKTLAETLVEEYNSKVPNNLNALQTLPRVGPYTARACLCFGYGESLAIVDANIATVIEDVFGYASPRRAHKDRALYAFLDALIPSDPDAARIFNLAVLDLRVLVCDDESVHQQCPFEDACLNRENN